MDFQALLFPLLALGLGAVLGYACSNLLRAGRIRTNAHAGAVALPQNLPVTDGAAADARSLAAALEVEREQLFADLHDDVGAKLLDLIYQAERPETQALARSALADLRAVVSNTRGYPASLHQALSDIQREAERRLGYTEISLRWEQQAFSDQLLSAAKTLQLFRIVREALSNVIRHAKAQHLLIKVAQVRDVLYIEIKDDGTGLSAANAAGRGTQSMRQRASELRGHITFRGATDGGTRVLLNLPLPEVSE